jgi:hypothetical protein
MKQSEVEIGRVYQVKVSGQLKPVRITAEDANPNYRNRRTRYYGTVLTTGRKITLTAGRMRKELKYQDNKSAAANDKVEGVNESKLP